AVSIVLRSSPSSPDRSGSGASASATAWKVWCCTMCRSPQSNSIPASRYGSPSASSGSTIPTSSASSRAAAWRTVSPGSTAPPMVNQNHQSGRAGSNPCSSRTRPSAATGITRPVRRCHTGRDASVIRPAPVPRLLVPVFLDRGAHHVRCRIEEWLPVDHHHRQQLVPVAALPHETFPLGVPEVVDPDQFITHVTQRATQPHRAQVIGPPVHHHGRGPHIRTGPAGHQPATDRL